MLEELMRGFGDYQRNIMKVALDGAEAEKPKDIAGIFLAKLPLPTVIIDKEEYSFYGARVGPGKAVRPHRHMHGAEPYALFSGQGLMHIGQEYDGYIAWNVPLHIHIGSTIVIPEGAFHCFYNFDENPVDFVFACPPGHLSDEDRFFADKSGLKNPMPPILGLFV